MLKRIRPRSLRNFKKYLKNNPAKFPKMPRPGDIWVTKQDINLVWEVTGTARVREMYMLAMGYPSLHLDTVMVFSINKSDNFTTSCSDTLDNFVSQHEFLRKKV